MEDAALARRWELTGRILEIDLPRQLSLRSWRLLRFNMKDRGNDVLVIIEVQVPEQLDQVAFCTGKDLASAVRTAYSLLVQDKLRWRDKKRWD